MYPPSAVDQLTFGVGVNELTKLHVKLKRIRFSIRFGSSSSNSGNSAEVVPVGDLLSR